MRTIPFALLPLSLTGCVTVHPPDLADNCRAEAAQAYIGRTATATLGGELLRVTSSRELRWIAPGMAVTMDYRTGRLTVSYDQSMRIATISCG